MLAGDSHPKSKNLKRITRILRVTLSDLTELCLYTSLCNVARFSPDALSNPILSTVASINLSVTVSVMGIQASKFIHFAGDPM